MEELSAFFILLHVNIIPMLYEYTYINPQQLSVNGSKEANRMQICFGSMKEGRGHADDPRPGVEHMEKPADAAATPNSIPLARTLICLLTPRRQSAVNHPLSQTPHGGSEGQMSNKSVISSKNVNYQLSAAVYAPGLKTF